MPDEKAYLDHEGLIAYNAKIQTQLGGKVNAVTGKSLSTEDFTSEEKEKLSGLKNYTLPVSNASSLGGVMISRTENPVPEKTAIKADATGKAFVDWSEAPVASTTKAGLIKLGAGFNVNEDGSIDVDNNGGVAESVPWSGITDKPDIALKSDLTTVYKYKGSVANYESLPTEDLEIGDVYDVQDTDMNYGWTGTKWDPLGQIFQIQAITNEQIDALFNNIE